MPLLISIQPGVLVGVLAAVLREDFSEPGLHDETLSVEMCEVLLQCGNIRLEA